jgi:hypothetical protein
VAERNVSVRSSVGPCILNGKISAITTFGKIDKKNSAARSPQSLQAFLTALFVVLRLSQPEQSQDRTLRKTSEDRLTFPEGQMEFTSFYQVDSWKDSEKIAYGQGSFMRKQLLDC